MREPSSVAEPAPRSVANQELDAKVRALCMPASYPVPVRSVEAIETHMSWVFLTEAFAWKLKKPVHEAEQDFSTPERRHFFCLEELRLNSRLAPDVYIDVVPLVRGGSAGFRVGGAGPVADWLVQMRRLPADQLLDRKLPAGTAVAGDMRAIAAHLAPLGDLRPEHVWLAREIGLS